MDGASPSAFSPTAAVLLGVLGLLITAVGPVLVALIQRGGKSQSVEIDQKIVVPRAEWDELKAQLEDLDEKGRQRDREHQHEVHELRAERDAYYTRAINAEAALARDGKGLT